MILLTGSNGQVGFELARRLPTLGPVLCAARAGADIALDLADLNTIEPVLDRARPQVIVNAAAYTAVDAAEDNVEMADRVNHRAVASIGAWAARNHALVVHYSTDYVFAGDGTSPYCEDQPIAPQSVYGRSKADGEIALRASGAAHLILRTAWVYAPRGKNFLLTMLRVAAERERLRVVDDQIGCPTSATTLADMTYRMLASPALRDKLGTYHVVSTGSTSWCGFARAIIQRAQQRGMLSRETPVDAITTGEYPAKARRPAYSVLSTAKLTRVFGIVPPSWQTGLDATMQQLQASCCGER